MNHHQRAKHRENLIAQAAAQRASLTQSIAALRAPIARLDQGLNLLGAVKRHPVWTVGGLVLFAAITPARAVKWLQRGWIVWQVAHRLSRAYAQDKAERG